MTLLKVVVARSKATKQSRSPRDAPDCFATLARTSLIFETQFYGRTPIAATNARAAAATSAALAPTL